MHEVLELERLVLAVPGLTAARARDIASQALRRVEPLLPDTANVRIERLSLKLGRGSDAELVTALAEAILEAVRARRSSSLAGGDHG